MSSLRKGNSKIKVIQFAIPNNLQGCNSQLLKMQSIFKVVVFANLDMFTF